MARARCRPDRHIVGGDALLAHPVHASHQLRRRPARRPPRDPHRAGLGVIALFRHPLGVGRLLANAAGDHSAGGQLDLDHAPDRDRGGKRHPQRRSRLRQGEAMGLHHLHRGEPRLRLLHSAVRAAGRAADPACRLGADGVSDPPHAAAAWRAQGLSGGCVAYAAAPSQAQRCLCARPRAAISFVPAGGKPDPGKPRTHVCLRQLTLAGARLLRRR